MPRQYSIVKAHPVKNSPSFTSDKSSHPTLGNKLYLFLGEIPNLPGHCVVAEYEKGKLVCGYHTENFYEINEEDV